MSVKKSEERAPLTGKQLLALVRSRLQVHKALGIDVYPANSDLQRFFALTDDIAGAQPGRGLSAGKIDTVTHSEELEYNRAQLQFLRQEVTGCTLCHLHNEKRGSIFGGGNPACSLMVVGDWSEQNNNNFSPKIYFGPDEDVMLWNMMAAIDLKPADIYVTNCLKCCPGGESPPDSLSEKSCFSYLEREIALTGTSIICAMGEVAARLLSGSSEPLARLRGKFVRYRYQSARDIIVMATYHPRFLLRHQEMKKAVWLDLQAIRKKLSAMT